MKGLLLRAISFSFNKTQTPFFNDLSTSFERDALHFIMGKNGVGKTTLFRILGGNYPADSMIAGTICIDDTCYDLTDARNKQQLKTRVQLVTQNPKDMTIGCLTVEENMQMASLGHLPKFAPLPSAKPLYDIQKQYGISPLMRVDDLSGGQRQVLAILMALQRHCSIVLLDEPTAALDDKNSALVLACIKEIVSKGIIVLFITHDKELARLYDGNATCRQITSDENGTRCISS